MLPLRMRIAVLARSLAGRVLHQDQEAFTKGFSLNKVSKFGSCGKIPKSEDECSRTLLQSKIQKKINQQNMRITKLTNQKNLILEKLQTGMSFYKLHQDTELERIRILGNNMLLKYMERSVKFVCCGATIITLLIIMYESDNFGPALKNFSVKVPCLTNGGESSSSDVNEGKGLAGKNL